METQQEPAAPPAGGAPAAQPAAGNAALAPAAAPAASGAPVGGPPPPSASRAQPLMKNDGEASNAGSTASGAAPIRVATASAPAASGAPAGGPGRRRLLDSDDDSPMRPRGTKKSKLLSDSSEDEVVVDKLRIAPSPQSAAAATGETQQKQQQQNGTNRTAVPPKRKAPASSRGDSASSGESSSSGDGSSSSDSSSSGDSSSSSDSSSDSSSGEESDSRSSSRPKSRTPAGKKRQARRGERKEVARARQNKAEQAKTRSVRTPSTGRKNGEGGESDEDAEQNEISMGAFDPKKRSAKDRLVAQFLRRWWYAWPQWPPENFDYSKELDKRKLKLVPLEEYEDLDDVDKGGYTKVYQISAFPGVFRDPHGNAIDLRPTEGRPCYKNAKQLSEIELLELIAKAIKGQMAALETSAFDETALQRALQQELEEVESELKQMQKRPEAPKARAQP